MVTKTAKKSKKKKKQVKLVGISHWSESDENAIDCEIACDCGKRANVVFGQKKFRQEADSYPQADICSAPYTDHDDTHKHTHTHTHTYTHTPDKSARRGGAPQASY